MDSVTRTEVEAHIATIIDRSRHHEEAFLTNTKLASENIIIYLLKERIIPVEEEEVVESLEWY